MHELDLYGCDDNYYTILNLSLDNAYTAVERMQESLSTFALPETTGEHYYNWLYWNFGVQCVIITACMRSKTLTLVLHSCQAVGATVRSKWYCIDIVCLSIVNVSSHFCSNEDRVDDLFLLFTMVFIVKDKHYNHQHKCAQLYIDTTSYNTGSS